MEEYGKRIAEHRKKAGLTQQELGDKLGVTPQAVSKWEKGLSQPDFDATKKMCEIFGISPGDLLGIQAKADGSAANESAAAAATAQPTVQTKIINGYCERCKKPVGPGEYEIYSTGTVGFANRGTQKQHIYCKDCYPKEMESRRKARATSAYSEFRRCTFKSLIVGGATGTVILLVLVILSICIPPKDLPVGLTVGLSIFAGYAYFAFITQLFWCETVTDLFFVFLHSFRMPGVIFTLDLDGLFFLIAVKLGLAALSVLLSVLVFLLGLIITPLYAAIIFPFSLPWRLGKQGKLKSEI